MKGRFAPSPTGHMHLGNLWIALLAYGRTRQQKGTFLVRIEDIDEERSKDEYVQSIVEDMEWLGFTWEEGPKRDKEDSYFQKNRKDTYKDYGERLFRKGLVYPCYCTRSRLRSIQSAPHEEGLPHYDGHCHDFSWEGEALSFLEVPKDIPAFIAEHKEYRWPPSWRLRGPDECIVFEDLYMGHQEFYLEKGIHDYIIAKGNDTFAYQLAVAIDDALMGVTEVIRGRDLLASTALQIYILKLLDLPIPSYGHGGLILDEEGIRLSKRQKGITIKELRQEGLSAEAIWGLLAYETKLLEKPYRHLSLKDLLEAVPFDNTQLKKDIKLTKFDIKSYN